MSPAATESSAADSVTLSAGARRYRPGVIDRVITGAILGGAHLMGAALGAYAGHSTGVMAGVAGAVVGLSAGSAIAAQTRGEDIKSGALVGALAGGILGASVGGTSAAVVMGIAGATLPYGISIGLASLLGY